MIEELLEQGVGILMLTSDYAEALEMSHRILVMRRGSIAKEFQRGEPTESDILREAIGEVEGAQNAAGSDRRMNSASGMPNPLKRVRFRRRGSTRFNRFHVSGVGFNRRPSGVTITREDRT